MPSTGRWTSPLQRDKMEYEPFLGEEAEEGVDLEVYTSDMSGPRAERVKKRKLILAMLGSAAILALFISGLVYATYQNNSPAPSVSPKPISEGDAGVGADVNTVLAGTKPSGVEHRFKFAVVAADSPICSTVGRNLLEAGGNAVDAAIGSLLCSGLTNPQSMGVGGGFFMTIYNATTGKGTIIDARETAPEHASEDMFDGDPKLSAHGRLSIAVPSELHGYHHAHQKYGRLPWASLFQPAIKMAGEGFLVSEALAHAIQDDKEVLETEPSLREVFFNKQTGRLFQQNEVMRRPQLAESLKVVAEQGMEAFQSGQLIDNIMADLKDIEAIVSKSDIQNYQVKEKGPREITLSGNLRMLSPPPPSSGAVLSFMMNILEGYNFKPESIGDLESKILTYHRTVEAFKFAYAKRTALGDEDFVDVKELVANLTSKSYAEEIRHLITDDATHEYEYYGPMFYTPEKTGTTHLSVLDQEGSAVSVTSTVNGRFGAHLRGMRSGIIWNNEMDDFSAPNITNEYGLPPTKSNFIRPGKRPLSSMCPAIVVGGGQGGVTSPQPVRLVLGAAGGSLITSTVAWIAEHNLWLGHKINEAVTDLRLHHQLVPPQLQYEEGFNQSVLKGFQRIGHDLQSVHVGKSIAQAIEVNDGWILAESDFRKGGIPDGF